MTSCMLPHLFLIRFSLVVSCMLGLRFFASAKLIASHRGKYFRTIASVVSTASGIYFSWRSQTVLLACSWPLSSKLQPTNHIIPTPPPEWSNDVINNLESIELWWQVSGTISGVVYSGFFSASCHFVHFRSWFTVEKGHYIYILWIFIIITLPYIHLDHLYHLVFLLYMWAVQVIRAKFGRYPP